MQLFIHRLLSKPINTNKLPSELLLYVRFSSDKTKAGTDMGIMSLCITVYKISIINKSCIANDASEEVITFSCGWREDFAQIVLIQRKKANK